MRRILVFALLVLVPGTVSSADQLVPRKGKKVDGAIVSRTETEVVFNIYWSRNPGVTNPDHVVKLPAADVKRVEERPHPEVEVFRRLATLEADDVDAYLDVGSYAKEHKLKGQAAMCFALACKADPEHKAALKAIGGKTKWANAQKGNIHLDVGLRDLLKRYIAEDDAAARVAIAADLKARGFVAKVRDLERYRRSALQPTGYQEDRPISYRSDQQPGAVYTLYVPKEYEPWRSWPLIIGLHGGGADGKAVDEVVGSGPSAMMFYRSIAAQRGYFVACPNARQAGWGNKDNETFVRDVITELRLLYNIDIDRIYMTGHSMGGFGTWALGPRLAEDLAGVSPMAGGGGTIGPLVETKTPIFIYHSDNDYVSVSSDRTHAKALKGTDLDFVYTELPGEGHGFPESIRTELFDFFAPRRRYDKKRKHAWPRSSFLGKPTKEEVRYLGDPMAELDGETPDLDTWIDHLRLGGGRALAAVTQIGETRPEGASESVAKVVRDAALPFDARAYAARTLGLLGDAAGAPALEKAVSVAAAKDQSMVAVEAARALATLGDRAACRALEKGIATWCAYLDDKRMGDKMRFSDWRRCAGTIAELVAAWAAVATPEDSASPLTREAVERVLGNPPQVETSERVPQDASTARTALAGALGRAYAVSGADAEAWERLLAVLDGDAKARAAATAARP